MQPGRYTELFFLDEATALAAGHRPCASCRREDYDRLCEIWSELGRGRPTADAIDRRLHLERVHDPTRTHRVHRAPVDSLPDGAFVLLEGEPHLILGAHLPRWTPGGYAPGPRRPVRGEIEVITPPSLVQVIRRPRAPAVPFLHPSAGDAVGGLDRTAPPPVG